MRLIEDLKATARTHAPSVVFFLKSLQRRLASKDTSNEEVFSRIYASGLWGGEGAMYSGAGSDDGVTAPFVETVLRFVRERGINSLVDLGCGDFRVGSQLAGSVRSYTGIDIAPNVIAANAKRYGGDNVAFLCRDITSETLPFAELCIVRQVLQHLSNRQIVAALANLRQFPFVIVGEHHPAKLYRPNLDKAVDHGTRISFGSGVYLEEPPFDLKNLSVLATTPLPPIVQEGEHLTIYLIENRRSQ